jgi:hypothetical protein
MEILAIQMKSDVVPNKFAAFVHKAAPQWPTGRVGSSSLKLLRTAIPALRDDQHVIVTAEYCPGSGRDELTEICEVFYHLSRDQWLAWPSTLADIS